jgi:hypothetical protein
MTSLSFYVFLPVFRILWGSGSVESVFRIRMFFGFPDPDPLVRGLDPDPDPLVRGMDPAPDPDPSINMQK